MRGWDQSHIDKLRTKAMVVDHTSPLPKNRNIVIQQEFHKDSTKPVRSVPREDPKPLTEMKRILKFMGVKFETEYQFLKPRKYRFDIAIPEKKLAVEYEGLMSNRSRHTTLVGYTEDTSKYNLAVINGWKVLRYTCKNYQSFVHEISQLL